MTKLLLDGDLFAYRCAASAENTDADVAKKYIDKLLDNCILDLGALEFQFYLTGPNNFRFKIYPEYKANRLDTVKPRHLQAMRDYLVSEYGAIISDGYEADDLMGIAQDKETGGSIIVSLDKDMLMIPGNHYSWRIEGGKPDKRWVREAKYQTVTKLQGLKWFYTQLLQGDVSDNIKGCSGIGKVKAAKLVEPMETEEEMFNAVRECYGCDEAMLMNGQCLWILRDQDKIWEFPFKVE